MSELYLMTTITDRESLSDFMSLFNDHGLEVNFLMLGHGTAGIDIISVLGLESNEKAVVMNLVTDEKWREVCRDMKRKLFIDVPGMGLSFIIPVSSIGGKAELQYLISGQSFEKGEESTLKGTEKQLLLAICNQGYNSLVMDAAREAGAGGGTLIHATGTGTRKAEQFLGITLASEKDVILIVTDSEAKNSIMQAIMNKAGKETKAKAVVFSLPVTDVVGIRQTEITENIKDVD